MNRKAIGFLLAGLCAGAVTGLFGAGGGMFLVPLLGLLTDTESDSVFPTSLSIILPICVVCIISYAITAPLPIREALPYLLGSSIGGILAGIYGTKIPTLWLHKVLGVLILWGGIRYLW